MVKQVAETSLEVIAAFMQQVIVEYHNYGAHHRRSEPREAVAIPVEVQPLDDELQPVGQPFAAITRDISFGGIGLFHRVPIDQIWLEIRLQAPETHEHIQLLAHVEHCTPCGGYHIIGCRYSAAETS